MLLLLLSKTACFPQFGCLRVLWNAQPPLDELNNCMDFVKSTGVGFVCANRTRVTIMFSQSNFIILLDIHEFNHLYEYFPSNNLPVILL